MSSIIVRELPKSGTLETANLYIKDTVVYYAVVHDVKTKYQSTDKEYSATVFVDEETKDKLLDEVLVNKSFALVGKDKTSKPPRRIKFPLSSQVEEGKPNYDLVEGMYGFSVGKPEFSKKGNKQSVNVIDTEGNEFTENVGNGSVCTLKLFGYRNQDNQLVVTLDTLQVIKHVPYEGKSSGDTVEDDVLGVSYKPKKVEKTTEDAPVQEKVQSKPANKAPVVEDDFDDSDSLPF